MDKNDEYSDGGDLHSLRRHSLYGRQPRRHDGRGSALDGLVVDVCRLGPRQDRRLRTLLAGLRTSNAGRGARGARRLRRLERRRGFNHVRHPGRFERPIADGVPTAAALIQPGLFALDVIAVVPHGALGIRAIAAGCSPRRT